MSYIRGKIKTPYRRRYSFMQIDTNSLISMTEANQNFSRVAKMVDANGAAVILKNNAPRYVLITYERFESEEFSADKFRAFKNEVKKLCKKYDLSIGHEDTQGGFILKNTYDEQIMKWFMDASVEKE